MWIVVSNRGEISLAEITHIKQLLGDMGQDLTKAFIPTLFVESKKETYTLM